jgi:hypothetical protein
MDRKIIPFPKASAPAPAASDDAILDRALFLADAEHAWQTTTVPQAAPTTARAVY